MAAQARHRGTTASAPGAPAGISRCRSCESHTAGGARAVSSVQQFDHPHLVAERTGPRRRSSTRAACAGTEQHVRSDRRRPQRIIGTFECLVRPGRAPELPRGFGDVVAARHIHELRECPLPAPPDDPDECGDARRQLRHGARKRPRRRDVGRRLDRPLLESPERGLRQSAQFRSSRGGKLQPRGRRQAVAEPGKHGWNRCKNAMRTREDSCAGQRQVRGSRGARLPDYDEGCSRQKLETLRAMNFA